MACCNPNQPTLALSDVLRMCWQTLHKNGTVRIDVLPCWRAQIGPQITYQHVRRSPTTTVYLEQTRGGTSKRTLVSSDALMLRLQAMVMQYAEQLYLQNEFWRTVVHRREIIGVELSH